MGATCIIADVPWCKYCQDLVKTWDMLGLHYENDNDTLIAKIDCTQNEVEDFRFVWSYPTMLFFPHGHKDTKV